MISSRVPKRVMSKKLLVILLVLLFLAACGIFSHPNGNQNTTPIKTITPITMVSEIDGVVLAQVPAGEFEMGADADEGCRFWKEYYPDCARSLFDNGEPAHQVYLDSFWIYQTEVTNAMYEQCVEAGACDLPDSIEFYVDKAYADHPVVYVNAHNAEDYCHWAGGRLPTEAEWEKAARGTDGRVYPWGNIFDGGLANYCDIHCAENQVSDEFDDGYSQTSPVGSYPDGSSPYGVLDMAGNVSEWVADGYDKDYYDNSPYENPKASSTFAYQVVRGGSWFHIPWVIQATFRSYSDSFASVSMIGFRCVLSP